MARRNEDFARLGSHGGGYTQALTVGKGFSGSARSAAKQQGGTLSKRGGGDGGSGGGGGGGNGTMNAYARHQELIRNYHRYHLNARVPTAGAIEANGLPGQRRLTDEQALRRQHRFVRDQAEDHRAHEARGLEGADADPHAWEVRMAAKYYKLLFKEYALADLSRYKEDKVGLRWRTEKDVVSGKGQFECGALRCAERQDLHSYELNFKYKEAGTVKNELVKVRVCPQCARKLFRKKIEALLRQRETEQEEADRERRRTKKAAGLSLDGTRDTALEPEEAGFVRSSDGVFVEGGRGSSAGALDSGVDGNGKETAVSGASSGAAGGGGHDLIRQAVTAAGGGEGARAGAAKKRTRASRWGAAVAPAGSAAAHSPVAATVDERGMPSGEGRVEPTSADNASRNAWAGELERDRTAEDEMDDYLSSLLL